MAAAAVDEDRGVVAAYAAEGVVADALAAAGVVEAADDATAAGGLGEAAPAEEGRWAAASRD